MREADLIHEIVDEQGRALPAGSVGEIAVTTLTREAMPLLRYRTGDEGLILQGECPCGSVFARLHVLGRLARRLRLPDGSFLRLSDLDSLLYALPFVQGYSATLHEAEEDHGPCLALDLSFAGHSPSAALSEAESALARVPGLRVVRKAGEAGETEGALPVLLRAAGEGGSCAEEAADERGKRIIRRSRRSAFAQGQGEGECGGMPGCATPPRESKE
jgi:hypothetical protein